MAACDNLCHHDKLQLECSPWAELAGFERPTPEKRLAATTKAGRNPLASRGMSKQVVAEHTRQLTNKLQLSFPGPLLLPKDELNWDPDHPAQAFRSWQREPERNKPSATRKTIYVVPAPTITDDVRFMKNWTKITTPSSTNERIELEPPSTDDLLRYIGSFYHGMDVRVCPQNLRFVPWAGGVGRAKRGHSDSYIGLATDKSSTRIRFRPSPDKKFRHQLNLDDILDAGMGMLPADAYAIILLMDIDLYEDEDDDFCCGRAYGGSRICVVSSARYNPSLDAEGGIDYHHMWPASHCMKFVEDLCAVEGVEPQTLSRPHNISRSALYEAVGAARTVGIPSTEKELGGLWFSRVACTAVHELGHCFGMDHCVYYACNLQGTAGIVEDVRQPPYLCPVCLEKVSYAIACEAQGRDQKGKEEYVEERYNALAEFCNAWQHVGLFAGYRAWLRARLAELSS